MLSAQEPWCLHQAGSPEGSLVLLFGASMFEPDFLYGKPVLSLYCFIPISPRADKVGNVEPSESKA